jgi:excisionase family DNA binding protein
VGFPLPTVQDVAERLNLSRWLVYDLVKAGRLRAVRLTPGRLRFTEAAVEEAVRQAEQAAPAAGAAV